MPSEAILQRDGKTFAITVCFSGEFVTPADLEKIAAVARDYAIPVVKMTSGQRFLLAGLLKKELPAIWKDIGMDQVRATAPCVKFVQACIGSDWCKYAVQDSIRIAGDIERFTSGTEFPAKFKIGVSGCGRNCSAGYFRDIGLFANTRGWTVTFGGNGGRIPRIGDVVGQNLATADTLDLVRRMLEYYRCNASDKERTSRFVERIGVSRIKSDVLSLCSYLPLEDAD